MAITTNQHITARTITSLYQSIYEMFSSAHVLIREYITDMNKQNLVRWFKDVRKHIN